MRLVLSDVAEATDTVEISGRQDRKTDISKLVYCWLSNNRCQWIHILYNVDEAGFLANILDMAGAQS